MSRGSYFLLSLLCLGGAFIGYSLAEHYIGRLPQHRGYFLVPVEDRVVRPPPRPRHTVVAVIDGLRADQAAGMHSVRRLREQGQCRRMDVGPVSVSRPVYAVLSTGLEQDRTGSRNNDEESPLHVDSIWQSARRGGLRVTAASELPWFRQLFPSGFDSYRLVPRAADHFTPADLGDLSLIHPIYVDEEGHEHGARSAAYATAVARADQELARLLARLDLKQDLLVFTADHGHTDRGGHGARSPEVSEVLTCFAGWGVQRRAETLALDARTVAPALAVLLGLPMPRHMHAGTNADDDDLERIWEVVDPRAFPAEYLSERRAAIQHFRQENAAALRKWLGRDGSWRDFYAQQRWHQAARALLFFGGAALLFLLMRRRILPARPLASALWIGMSCLVLAVSYVAVRGSFDFTSINQRRPFILISSALCLGVSAAAFLIHILLWRDRVRCVLDQVRLTALLLLLNIGHVFTFGWPLGFPLPNQALLFFPFLGGVALLWAGFLGLLGLGILFVRPALLPAAPGR